MPVTWDILLPTLPHRHGMLCRILAEIDRQWQPGLGMLIIRDNLQRGGNASYGKWQDLQEWSQADYTSFIGDDDWFDPQFVAKIMAALETDPDYVGFKVRYTYDGVPQQKVEHRLAHAGWYSSGDTLYRDLVHHNPIRRQLALLTEWDTSRQDSDVLWAAALRSTGRVRTEVWIPEELYYYQETSRSWTRWPSTGRPEPLPEEEIEPIPEYHWLKVRDEV
jgi:hypothetical protein